MLWLWRQRAETLLFKPRDFWKELCSTQNLELAYKKARKHKTFILRDPKTRKISKSYFRDRVVHHALCNIIEPFFEKMFIYDSYANRKGKGMPLGNLTSQFFANVYLNELDQFAIHRRNLWHKKQVLNIKKSYLWVWKTD